MQGDNLPPAAVDENIIHVSLVQLQGNGRDRAENRGGHDGRESGVVRTTQAVRDQQPVEACERDSKAPGIQNCPIQQVVETLFESGIVLREDGHLSGESANRLSPFFSSYQLR